AHPFAFATRRRQLEDRFVRYAAEGLLELAAQLFLMHLRNGTGDVLEANVEVAADFVDVVHLVGPLKLIRGDFIGPAAETRDAFRALEHVFTALDRLDRTHDLGSIAAAHDDADDLAGSIVPWRVAEV